MLRIDQKTILAALLLGLGVAASADARVITAHVVALDQTLTLNRFGAYEPLGMVYALRRDVVDSAGNPIGSGGLPGQVMVRPDLRPRPLVLRGNVGDTLEVHFTNLLSGTVPVGPPEVEPPDAHFFPEPIVETVAGPAPSTRRAGMLANGLLPLGDTHDPVVTGLAGIAPGASVVYRWTLEREGTHLISSLAAPSGGEGNGGSTVHGLFGAIHVEPAGSVWYRSQLTAEEMAAITVPSAAVLLPAGAPRAGAPRAPSGLLLFLLACIAAAGCAISAARRTAALTPQGVAALAMLGAALGAPTCGPGSGAGLSALATGAPFTIDYEAVDAAGVPIVRILDDTLEIVHADLNAIIVGPAILLPDEPALQSNGRYREFTVIFHDEIHAVQASPLLTTAQMAGVRDGFAINYGSSGLGPMILANRSGSGPAADCIECAYEEFFLESWANGDPSLLPSYAADPSGVHHSYMNDAVRFRNLHAGPAETHIFHLHAHQWVGNPEGQNSTYLDSQTLGPQQGFSYDITWGGSGNRNKTPGDSIFHCHLYPHFAQGMWELWRSHDVFEDGTRMLPDGELGPGTDVASGAATGGTPVPGVVPIPGVAMPPQPSYGPAGMPGFPFYIAGRAGHRTPQAPLDIAVDGGLGRHIVVGGTRTLGAGPWPANDFSSQITSAEIVVLPESGTPLEQRAMNFHAGADVASFTPEGDPAPFEVNGLPPTPGAPFAEPCTPELVTGNRDYHVSYIELDLLVNSAGWHDPQGRINVLDSDVTLYEGQTRTADPFFFRANSGECITFYHTNRASMELELDDFQVRTPTDTIGQHIHLVKFDVTASDGSGNGWNYEDGTFSREAIIERIEASHALGGSAVDIYGNPISLAATGDFQTTTQRWFADPLMNLTGQDRTLRTVFTHDHFAPSSVQQHGFYNALVVEPAGSSWLAPDGSPLAGGVGTQAMIVGADDSVTHPDHREFMVAIADFAIVYDANGSTDPLVDDDTGFSRPIIRPEHGRPVNAPLMPEAISNDDPGGFVVNYKNEPLPLRIGQAGPAGWQLKPGQSGDMAHVFDSRVHGDPFTEIFKAYEGDRVVFRLIQGAQEEQHVFTVDGMGFRREISNASSGYVASQEVGISEHFELDLGVLPGVDGGRVADYLYRGASTDDMWNGAWGLMRVFSSPAALDPENRLPVALATLPNNPTGSVASLQAALGAAVDADGCPVGAPQRSFEIEAWAAQDLLPGGSLVYNAPMGIADPSGLLFVHASDVADLQSGAEPPEPLVIRANAGDCIRVGLTNHLPQNVPDHLGDALLVPITGLESDSFRPSNKVSLRPQLVAKDPFRSDAAAIGRNRYSRPQLAIPGQRVEYSWYAGRMPGDFGAIATPEEFGVVNLESFGDVIKQGVQGLIGALVIEPQGAFYTDPISGAPALGGTKARIHLPDGSSFPEFVVVYQAGMNLLQFGADMPSGFIAEDAEDSGEMGVNYRTEPFCARLGMSADCDANDSIFPADFFTAPIETPVFTASAGENVVFRVAYPSGPARQTSFLLQGHNFPVWGLGRGAFSPGVALMSAGRSMDIRPFGGIQSGTWLFRTGSSYHFPGGMWGRVEVP